MISQLPSFRGEPIMARIFFIEITSGVFKSGIGVFLFVKSLHGQYFFKNRVNSWLKDRKERTGVNIKTMGST